MERVNATEKNFVNVKKMNALDVIRLRSSSFFFVDTQQASHDHFNFSLCLPLAPHPASICWCRAARVCLTSWSGLYVAEGRVFSLEHAGRRLRWRTCSIGTIFFLVRSEKVTLNECEVTELALMRPEKATLNEWRESKTKDLSGDCW